MADVAVIIVNWNGKKYLKDCFDSFVAQSYKNFKIVFVDNGSEDGSVDYLRENYLETGLLNSLEIMSLETNTGFCFGYNSGIKKALEDPEVERVITLNNDTKLHEKFIESMIGCSKVHPEAGSIQPKILNFYEKNKIDCTGILIARDGTVSNRGYGEIDAGQFETETEIFGANGTASLFSRKALERTVLQEGNYFDNAYFAYYEDADLAWRLKLTGFLAYYCPKAVVFHIQSGSVGKHSIFKAYYLHRNYFFTVFKNYPTAIMIRTLASRANSYLKLIFNVFKKEKREEESARGYGKSKVALIILKAWGSVIYNLPKIIIQRRAIKKIKKVSRREIKLWLKQYQADL